LNKLLSLSLQYETARTVRTRRLQVYAHQQHSTAVSDLLTVAASDHYVL